MADFTTASPGRGRDTALDGLRGYAAVAVVLYHAILSPVPALVPDVVRRGIQAQADTYGVALKLVLAVLSGDVAVSVFFVISGIVLFRALLAMHRSAGLRAAAATSWRFVVRRLVRIWPVMAVCLVAKVVLFRLLDLVWPALVDAPAAADLLPNLLLVAYPIHGATWTLMVELAAVPLLLACFFAVRRFGALGLLPFGAYVVLALAYHKLLFRSPFLIAGLPFLVAGMAVECGWLRLLMRRRLRGTAVAVALLVLMADLVFVPEAQFKLRMAGLLCTIPLLVAWVHSADRGFALRLLLAPVSNYLGRISFSLYLWNVPILELILFLLHPALAIAYPLEVGLVTGIAAVAITVPIAHLSERWLERPCIRAGRWLTERRGRPWQALAEPGKIAPHASPG